MDDLTLEQANAAVAAAVAKARQIDAKMNIAVVDAGANLKAFARMDGAWLGSIDVAIRKARTARFFDMNTGEIGKLSQPGGSLFGIEHSNGGLIWISGRSPHSQSRAARSSAPLVFRAARSRTTTPWPRPCRGCEIERSRLLQLLASTGSRQTRRRRQAQPSAPIAPVTRRTSAEGSGAGL